MYKLNTGKPFTSNDVKPEDFVVITGDFGLDLGVNKNMLASYSTYKIEDELYCVLQMFYTKTKKGKEPTKSVSEDIANEVYRLVISYENLKKSLLAFVAKREKEGVSRPELDLSSAIMHMHNLYMSINGDLQDEKFDDGNIEYYLIDYSGTGYYSKGVSDDNMVVIFKKVVRKSGVAFGYSLPVSKIRSFDTPLSYFL